MNMSSFQKLLEKEMDRKEFLVYVGVFLLTFTGISSFLKSISESIHTDTQSSGSQSFGYGVYGGVKRGGGKRDG